jgi:hypothetical protein
MKFFFILMVLLACSHTDDVKVNLYSKKIMDIEIPTTAIISFCTIPRDPEQKNAWLGIYIFYNARIERLAERRQRLPKDCEKYKAEMTQLLNKSVRARVIGFESHGGRSDHDLAILTGNPKLKSIDEDWTFSRVITEKGCFGWEKGCEEPRLIEKDRYENIYE